MAREGLDIPSLNSLLLASPVSDVEQAVGRILRKKSEIVPLIVDIADNFSLFNSMSYKRLNLYKKNEFLISTISFVDENLEIKNNNDLLLDTSKITFNIDEDIENIKKENDNKKNKKKKANPFSSDDNINDNINNNDNDNSDNTNNKCNNNDSNVKLISKKSCYVFLSSDEED